jgi:hypothetical protein
MCIPVLCVVAAALAAGADGAKDPGVDDILEQRFQRVAGTAYGGAALDSGSPGTWYDAYASGATVCYDGKIADRKSDFTVWGAGVPGAGGLLKVRSGNRRPSAIVLCHSAWRC